MNSLFAAFFRLPSSAYRNKIAFRETFGSPAAPVRIAPP
jgi:hypothetical protein